MAGTTVEGMTAAVREFVAALGPEQRGRACYRFDDEEARRNWHYTPMARPGVAMIELDAPRQQLARKVVRSGLSEAGYNTAMTIMSADAVLASIERFAEGPFGGYSGPVPSRRRDPNAYFLAAFGEPGGRAWGWSFGGHHISLHYTIVDGELARPAPAFLGSNPASFPLTGGVMLRPLAACEDLARALLGSLDERQQAAAILSSVAPADIVQSNRRKVEDGALPVPLAQLMNLPSTPGLERRFAAELEALATTPESQESVRYSTAPKGLSVAELDSDQAHGLRKLLGCYLDRMPPEIAEREERRIAEESLPAMHFAWAGSTEAGKPHYYRLQAPRFLIEYDNAQDDANHVHSVWRDPDGDFGDDLLARHYREAHR